MQCRCRWAVAVTGLLCDTCPPSLGVLLVVSQLLLSMGAVHASACSVAVAASWVHSSAAATSQRSSSSARESSSSRHQPLLQHAHILVQVQVDPCTEGKQGKRGTQHQAPVTAAATVWAYSGPECMCMYCHHCECGPWCCPTYLSTNKSSITSCSRLSNVVTSLVVAWVRPGRSCCLMPAKADFNCCWFRMVGIAAFMLIRLSTCQAKDAHSQQ